MRKPKVTPPPRILEIKFPQTFKDIPEVLKNLKFLHPDEIVGSPVPNLFGIQCGL